MWFGLFWFGAFCIGVGFGVGHLNNANESKELLKKDDNAKQVKNPIVERNRKKGQALKNGKLKQKFVRGPGKFRQVSVYDSVQELARSYVI